MTEASETPSCPRCGKERFEGAMDCPFCGIVFARFEEPAPAPARQTEGTAAEDDGLYRGPTPGTLPAGEGIATPNPSADVSGSRPIQILQIPIERSWMTNFLQFDLTRSMLFALFFYVVTSISLGQIFGGTGEPSEIRRHHFSMTGVEAPLRIDQEVAPGADLHVVGREVLFLSEFSSVPDELEAVVFVARRRTLGGHQGQVELRHIANGWLGALGSGRIIRSVETSIRGAKASVDVRHPGQSPDGLYSTVTTFEYRGRPTILILAGTQGGVIRLTKHYFDDDLGLRRIFRLVKREDQDAELPPTDPRGLFQPGFLIGAGLLILIVGSCTYLLAIRSLAHWLDLEGGLGRALLVALLSVPISLIVGFISILAVALFTTEPSDLLATLVMSVVGIVSSTLAVLIVYTAEKREAMIVALGSSAASTAVVSLLTVMFFGF